MNINSNMTGNVWKILVNQNDQIQEGQDLVILESMKMEIPITSESSGVIEEINIQEGDFVNEGDPIIKLK